LTCWRRPKALDWSFSASSRTRLVAVLAELQRIGEGNGVDDELLNVIISTSVILWDNPVRQGTILYLVLEDDYKRLQTSLYVYLSPDLTYRF
jgi:hypothetical protein